MLQHIKDYWPAVVVIAAFIIAVILLSHRARNEDKRRAKYNDFMYNEREHEFFRGERKDSRA